MTLGASCPRPGFRGKPDRMLVTLQCPRCGEPLQVDRSMMGKRIRCVSCEHEFKLTMSASGDPASSSLTEEIPVYRPAPAQDETLSRSMLPVKGTPVVPPDEMLCRLEPQTLHW